MNNYRFSAGSPVSNVGFTKANGYPSIAKLSAAENASQSKLSEIRRAMEANGWVAVPAMVDGKNILEIRGFGSEQQCVDFLSKQGFIKGVEGIDSLPEPQQETCEPTGWQKFLQQYSLRIAGVANLIGDVGFLGNGLQTKDKYKIAGGALYTLGGANLTLFGKPKDGQGEEDVTAGMANVLQQKHSDIGETALGNIVAQQTASNAQAANSFLAHHGVQNTLLAYTAGAGAMLASGIKKHRAGEGSAALGYGISSFALKSLSLLIPEKLKKERVAVSEKDEKNNGVISGMIEWVREKPLRLFGYGSLVTDSLLALDTYQTYKNNPQKSGYMWAGVTTTSYIVADLMMAISNKNPANTTDRFNEEEQRYVEALAAEALIRQPKETRECLLLEVAEFLAKRPETQGDAATISSAIKSQLTALGSSPWVERIKTQMPPEQEIMRGVAG